MYINTVVDNTEVSLQAYNPGNENWEEAALSLVVIGASGDLAKKKIYPALFALYVEGHMPEYFTIWGFARSKMSNEEFREYIGTSLSCRLTDKGNCAEKFDAFLERCFYHPGQYSNRDDFAALSEKMKEPEKVLLLKFHCPMHRHPPIPWSSYSSVVTIPASLHCLSRA